MRQIYLVNIVTFFSFLNLGEQTSEIDITSSLDNTIFKDLLIKQWGWTLRLFRYHK